LNWETSRIPSLIFYALAESIRLIDKLAAQGMHMSNELLANRLLATETPVPASPPAATGANDYQSFCAALSESARGRAFLAEYGRRNRNADTEMVLAALDRLAALMRADGTALERLRDELRVLLIAIRLARPDIEAARPLTKAAKLASLLDMLARRIETMAEAKPVEIVPPIETDAAAETVRGSLSVVPSADEPELPIPSPPNTQLPPIALVHATETMPEIAFIEKAPPKANLADVAEASIVESVVPLPAARSDPLAPIMALSEAERIALFT
jgi:hypothetical protein